MEKLSRKRLSTGRTRVSLGRTAAAPPNQVVDDDIPEHLSDVLRRAGKAFDGSKKVKQQRAHAGAGWIETAADLVGRTWNLYRLSPLHGLSFAEEDRLNFAQLLSVHLNNEVPRKASMPDGMVVDSAWQCDVIVLEGLGDVIQEAEYVKSLCISVYRLSEDANNENVAAGGATNLWITKRPRDRGPELTMVLCGARGVTLDQRTADGAEHLRVGLVKGARPLATSVISWLQKHFDCCCSPLRISSAELHCVVFQFNKWFRQFVEKNGGPQAVFENPAQRTKSQQQLLPFEFTFSLPPTIPGLKTITLSIEAHGMLQMYTRIFESYAAELPDDSIPVQVLVNNFTRHIYEHFSSIFHINLEGMSLTSVASRAAMLSGDGKLKLLAPEGQMFFELLQYLTSISEEN